MLNFINDPDPTCVLDSLENPPNSPAYVSNSESDADIFSPSPCSKRRMNSSYSSKRDLLSSFSSIDRALMEQVHKVIQFSHP